MMGGEGREGTRKRRVWSEEEEETVGNGKAAPPPRVRRKQTHVLGYFFLE